MDGLIKKELLSGNPDENASVTKRHYLYNERKTELTETFVSNNLPDSFEAFYHQKPMDNTMKCNFIEPGDNLTRYEYEFEYTRVERLMPRLMTHLFPGMFRMLGEKWMNQFKDYVEELSD